MARKKRTDHKGYVLRVGEYQDREARFFGYVSVSRGKGEGRGVLEENQGKGI